MARIPDAEIERLKDEVSLVRLVESSGLKLAKRGADMVANCPFHDDATPSFVVTPAKNLFNCFGCGAAGGPIDWVMKRQGVSFRHAVELLRDDMVGDAALDAPASSPVRWTVRRLAPPVSLDADDRALLVQVVDYYHETLKGSAEALGYLKARGLDHPELIERFRLGYADRTLGLRLPDKTRKAGADIRARLERVGLYRASGHEHFTGSVVVPVLGEGGVVTEVYGRKMTGGSWTSVRRLVLIRLGKRPTMPFKTIPIDHFLMRSSHSACSGARGYTLSSLLQSMQPAVCTAPKYPTKTDS